MIVLKTIMVCFAALNVLSMFSVWCLVLIQQCLAISTLPARNIPRADKKMQLYHHPLDLDSQRVRFALEEEGVDYTSHHVNPITGKNLDSSFFKMNRHGRVPVFQNGSHIIYNTIDIIQYALFFTHALFVSFYLFLLIWIDVHEWNLLLNSYVALEIEITKELTVEKIDCWSSCSLHLITPKPIPLKQNIVYAL